MWRSIAYMFAGLLMAVSCTENGFVPRNGDLVFRVAGMSGAGQAIVSATAWGDSVKYEHVGIIEVAGNEVNVIEATGRGGVVRTPFDVFLSDSPEIGGRPGVTVMRVRIASVKGGAAMADSAVVNALGHLGEEYDWYYLHGNGRMYCSELVYESWLDSLGNHVFGCVPMNFRDVDGNMLEYWTELFGKLGRPVPEGEPGTNPNGMSKSSLLEQVHRYF